MRKLFLEQRGFQEFSQANADLKNKKTGLRSYLSGQEFSGINSQVMLT